MSNTDGACVLACVCCVCDTFMCVCVMWVMIRPLIYYYVILNERYCGCPIQGCIWKSKECIWVNNYDLFRALDHSRINV